MGRRSRKPRDYRDVDGILLLDKPLGLSSNKALQAARHVFRANKAGHTGSLDPLATGLLPVCFGEATKFSAFLLEAAKRYRAECRLGVITSTGDAEGEVLETRAVEIDRDQVEAVLPRFTGRIEQTPPMHSAVKHQGERLYNLARKGIEVERAPRTVEIHALELVALEGERLVLDIHCSKGTYIRTLAEDIGEALGCGASLSALERTGVQPFWEDRRYTLDELRAIREQQGDDALLDCLLPIEAALREWPEVTLSSAMSFYLKQGQPVQVPGAPLEGLVRLCGESEGFLGVGQILGDGRVAPKRLLRAKS
jgi:tRNA pseudouridine55 synthase